MKTTAESSASRPISMISALALGPLPELAQSELGDRALSRIFRASGLTGDLLYIRDGYIPQPALTRFFREFAREAGERWVIGPWVNAIQISDYGLWGDWILSAPSLREGLLRGCASIHLHGTNDRLGLATRNGKVTFSYAFAESTSRGYGELAIGGAAALLSYCRAYLGPDWVPDRIDLNVPRLKRRDLDQLEIWYGCRVDKSEDSINLVFDEALLKMSRQKRPKTVVTYEDIVRERIETRPTSLPSQVQSIVRRNLSEGLINIDETARALDMAVRTLQQKLNADGANYRDIVKTARIERAQELLTDGAMSVTEIAHELGYEHSPHFTRMFGKEMGISPSAYLKEVVAAPSP